MREISCRLKKAIQSSGFSHRELESITGIPHSAIQRYASGATERMPIDRLELLAKALNTTAEYLIGWDGKEDTQNTRPLVRLDTETLSEVESEILLLCRKMTVKQKNRLLSFAYQITDEG